MKKDISKVLASGSLEARLKLLAESQIEEAYPDLLKGGAATLTKREISTILDSLKSEREIDAYNKLLKYMDGIFSGTANLQTMAFEVRAAHNTLYFSALLSEYQEATELGINVALARVAPEEFKRAGGLIKKALEGVFLLNPSIDGEGFLHLEKESLQGFIKDRRAGYEASAGRYKAIKKALLDFAEEKKITPEGLKKVLKEFEATASLQFILSRKYHDMPRDEYWRELVGLEGKTKLSEPADSRAQRLLKGYAVIPGWSQIEPDKDTYTNFKKNLESYG